MGVRKFVQVHSSGACLLLLDSGAGAAQLVPAQEISTMWQSQRAPPTLKNFMASQGADVAL
ncbi:MAG: hypothetical protein ACXW2I_16460, partial [Burkholderiales bacterium]